MCQLKKCMYKGMNLTKYVHDLKRTILLCRFLIEHGANVASVNNDGELPVDIAESDEMEDMLQQHIDEQGMCILAFLRA